MSDDLVFPHNLEAERSVLGAVLVDNRAMDEAIPVLTAEDFYRDAHQRVYRALVALHQRNSALDLVTLKDELQRRGDLEAVGGPAYVSELVSGVPSGTNVEYYARIVREKSSLRQIITKSTALIAQARSHDADAAALLDHAQHAMLQVGADADDGFVGPQEFARVGRDEMDRRLSFRGHTVGVPTGLTDLDAMTRGMEPDNLIVAAARPGQGKTAFALTIALDVAIRQQRPVLFYSLEMSREELVMRALVQVGHMDAKRVFSGLLSEVEQRYANEAFQTLTGSRLHVNDRTNLTAMQVRSLTRRRRRQHGADVVIVDYLQLLTPDVHVRRDNRTRQVGESAWILRQLARELKIPVLCLAQLNRDSEKGGTPRRPSKAELRDSGETEQHANLIWLLHRPEMYEPENESVKGVAEVILAKQRNGESGIVRLLWIGSQMRLTNMAR